MPTASADPRRIDSLDGMRALSIGLVLFEHSAGVTGFPLSLATLHSTLGDLGTLGVRIFFVISGFLITTLLIAEREKTGRVSLGGFYLRRLFRIFPAAYFFIAIVFVLDRVGVLTVMHNDFLAALTYTMNFHREKAPWMLHLWSLSVEEQFYMLWPAAMLVAGRIGAGWIAAAQILIAPILRIITWFYFPEHRSYQEFQYVMDSIAAGCLLAIARPWLKQQPLYCRLLASRWFFVLPIALGFTCMAAEHSFKAYMAHASILNVGIALCIDRVVTFPTTPFGRLLNVPAIRYVGTLSYSIYLWQELFMERGSPALVQRFPLNLLCIAGMSLFSFYAIEQPALRLRVKVSRLLSPKRAPT